jgi:hypothetical protein
MKTDQTSRKTMLLLFLLILSSIVQGQQRNITCEKALPFCTGTDYSFPAGINGSGHAQPGPYYGCLRSQPNTAWYYMKIKRSGNLKIKIYTTPSYDVDFICWGPYDSKCCCNSLTRQKVVDCSYSQDWKETCNINGAHAGEYYMLLLTNYSNKVCNINFFDEEDVFHKGTTDCSVVTPPCTASVFIENITYTATEPLVEGNPLIVAGNKVSDDPCGYGLGDVLVTSTANVKYKAVREVGLKNGFHAESGSEFHAWIAPCGSDAWDTPDPRGQNYDMCIAPAPNNCIKIGGNYSPGNKYAWSPTAGLDNPKSPNPTLCLPTNGMGCKIYKLMVMDNAGHQIGPLYPFTIRYWPANSTNWLEFKNYPGYYEKVDHWYCDLTFPHNTRQIVVIFSQADRIYEIKLNAFIDWIPDCGSGFINYHFDTKDWPGYDWKAYDFYYIGFDYYVFCSEQRVQSHGPQWHPQW